MTKGIMIQGAGSNVGKSTLVAGLCRLLHRNGVRVRPFKPQNMSNNAAVTPDGAEIGRAQALQARAACTAPHVDMNPILLKPETDVGAQVIVQGKRYATLRARDYGAIKAELMAPVLESFHRLASDADMVVVEGAGSPAEINLRDGDIANMGFAEAANLPVILAGDIDRGGVIAQLVGTKAVLPVEDAARICGFLVNKFRGDPSLFDGGRRAIVEKTGWADLGVVPWFPAAWKLPAEDILDLSSRRGDGSFKVAVPHFPRIANFDDLDPLMQEPKISVELVPAGRALPGDADLVLLPGSKSTISDLEAFRNEGWDIDLQAHIRRGGHVLGLCGGYQMLGKWIRDPNGIEGSGGDVRGLGHLDVTTELVPEKRLALTDARHPASGTRLSGYEIHVGRTGGADCANAWLEVNGAPEGASARRGQIRGTYLHGLFAADPFRRAFLAELGLQSGNLVYEDTVDTVLNDLADHIAAHLDVDRLASLAAPILQRPAA